MNRETFLRHLRRSGCYLKREGAAHSLWASPISGAVEAVPRHTELSDLLCRKICRRMGIPQVGDFADDLPRHSLETIFRTARERYDAEFFTLREMVRRIEAGALTVRDRAA